MLTEVFPGRKVKLQCELSAECLSYFNFAHLFCQILHKRPTHFTLHCVVSSFFGKYFSTTMQYRNQILLWASQEDNCYKLHELYVKSCTKSITVWKFKVKFWNLQIIQSSSFTCERCNHNLWFQHNLKTNTDQIRSQSMKTSNGPVAAHSWRQ